MAGGVIGNVVANPWGVAMKTRIEERLEQDPMDPRVMSSLKHWGQPLENSQQGVMPEAVELDCGWGRLMFGQTFSQPETLAKALRREKQGCRDIALYVREPNVVLSCAPQELFLDPSLTYRLDFRRYQSSQREHPEIRIRECQESDCQDQINRLYMARNMVPAYDGFYAKISERPELTVLVAEELESNDIVGVVTGVDHVNAFQDPDNGCSLWALSVDPQARVPAIGECLVRHLIERMQSDGRDFMDLSVMHKNRQAIALYDKLGFVQVPVYCIKNKNSINEQLFIGPDPEEDLNVYARLITKEARRRGIGVEVLDAEGGFFRLTLGGRVISCRESLTELTSAVAMSRCDDKAVTRRIMQKVGLRVPEQQVITDEASPREFIQKHHSVVVKPARGEQGRGIQVGLTEESSVARAIAQAQSFCDKVLLEECVQGDDLRIIVIDYQVVAAAIRKPPVIVGDGVKSIETLISKLSRRRAAATDGESRIPIDEETERCVQAAGFSLSDVLAEGQRIQVRKTANLHTGGTIHDVTDKLHSVLASAAIRAAKALEIPVVGLDMMVPDVSGPDYVIIEANERPGLANHEPQPTVERFVDLLFPNTRSDERRKSL